MVPDREGLGRSRGGLTTKIHLVADSRCRPIARVTTAGQRHDSVAFTAVMADISISRSCGGPPRTRPDRVLADKAYSSQKIRNALRRRGIKATIPEPSTQIAGRVSRGSKGGRPPKFDKEIYKNRNTVERAINRLRGYGRWPPGMTNGSSSTGGWSMSRASGSGYANPPTMIRGTRPSTTVSFMLILSACLR